MKFDPPQLRIGGLSGAVYVITHGKEIETASGPGIEASRKYDVTDQFGAVAVEKLLSEGVIAAATDPMQSNTGATERVLRDALAAAFPSAQQQKEEKP